ncbi:FAD/NAD(P)-binding protein [Moritella sp. Urea-trap-13]|uniref:FAD/NAD(P)-binding protein n=1 Tax=Moritella sp. Urea-trap-13 TaxID=2058327 RepID=UPI000C3300D5|nr:FAD/NAD(P)-binding protein [Moritella sp. Urea-trap-13]PKH06180.1 oxidoreductase [Moritella sp. Urea-trap-13]
MPSHIPDTIQLVDHVEDSEHTRHYRFRFINTDNTHNWQQTLPGQFFMLNVPGAGEAPFSFTEPPNANGEFRALIRRMGVLTSALFNMQAGDILGARGPFGVGWPLAKIRDKNLLIVAGGCGLAPLVSLINTVNSGSKKQPVTLVYGARNRTTQMLKPERLLWQKEAINVVNVLEDLSPNDKHSINEYKGTPMDFLPSAVTSFVQAPTIALLCGPEQMMHSVANYLLGAGFSADAIFLSVERRMHCALGLCGHCYIHNKYACKQGPTFSWQDLQQLRQQSMD